ncbi:MAG: dipeptidase [Candidatus Hydrogenedentota bacterium]
MLVFDAHLDLAWNAQYYARDLKRTVHEIRQAETGMPERGRAAGTVAFPELRKGQVGMFIATLLARSTGTPVRDLDYPSWPQAYASAQAQWAYYMALQQEGIITLIRDRAALNRAAAAWKSPEAKSQPFGMVLSMEGADPIRSPETLQEWWDQGLRLLGPGHYGPGRYAGGTGTSLGFSEIGFELLKEMARIGIGLDVTHLTDKGFDEALDRYEGPLLASHSNCRALVPHERQFTDVQLKRIIERGGVIGSVFDIWMLQPGFRKFEQTNEGITLTLVVDQIDHICQLAGNCRHAAIGSDLDGLFGLEQSPCDMDTIADLQKLPDMLRSRGYGEDDIAAIMHGNWLDLLGRILPEP